MYEYIHAITGTVANRFFFGVCVRERERPPLWSSVQISWLHIQKSGFDSWRYQIF
jgi:hypothetical protein